MGALLYRRDVSDEYDCFTNEDELVIVVQVLAVADFDRSRYPGKFLFCKLQPRTP